MQTGARVLRAGAQWLWLVSLALAALAVWIARGRRRIELRAIAIGIIVVGLLMLGARRLGGAYLVDALADTDAATPATRNAYDIVTQALADRAWVWVTLGLLLLLGVWLAGSGDLARRARTRLAPVAHNPAVSYGAAGALVLVLFTFVPVFQRGFLGALILIGFLAVGVEVLRRQIQREHPDVQAIGRAPT
jgi:hypothetical protein